MGVTVRERDGAWWVFIHHKTCSCKKGDNCPHKKRKAKRIGVGDVGKKAAKEAAAKIQAKLALGDVGILTAPAKAAPVPSFTDVAATWEKVTAPAWKRGTQISYGDAIRHRLLPAFGALPITHVTADRVEAWWTAARAEGLSKKYLATLRVILRGICRRAVSDGLLTVNPVERIEGRLGRVATEIRPADYLTPEELAGLLRTAEHLAPREYPIYLLMATCGLRIGEAVALQVGDLDVAGLRLHIRRTVRRGYIASPKSGKAGVVDVPASTMRVLGRVKELRQVEAAVNGGEPRWLFPGQTPEMPECPEVAQRTFQRVLKAAGIRYMRPHDLRHTYATLAIQAGVPLLTVSRQLRHASISTTADLYTHAVPGSDRAAAEALEAILTGNHTQPPRNPTA